MRSKFNTLSLSLLVAALSACGASDDINPDAQFLELLSVKQCERTLDALTQRFDDLKARIAAGSAQMDVLEKLQVLRQDIPAAEGQCVASKASAARIRSIDEELDELELRLTMEGYR